MPNNEAASSLIDIREDCLLELSQEVLENLLLDHTTGKNIFWATHDYESLGNEYDYHAPIMPELIAGERGMIIRPRVLKSKSNQSDRSRGMAEVFTPSWICNAQNKLKSSKTTFPCIQGVSALQRSRLHHWILMAVVGLFTVMDGSALFHQRLVLNSKKLIGINKSYMNYEEVYFDFVSHVRHRYYGTGRDCKTRRFNYLV